MNPIINFITYQPYISFWVLLGGSFLVGTLVSFGVFSLLKRYITSKQIDKYTDGLVWTLKTEISVLLDKNEALELEKKSLLHTVKVIRCMLAANPVLNESDYEIQD